MKRSRRGWFSFLADLAIRIHPNRPTRDDAEQRAKRIGFEGGTAHLGLRMTDWLRTRLRPKWLRLRTDKRA